MQVGCIRLVRRGWASEAVIAVAGAGSIGCYVGGCLALAGRRVTFLGRPALAEEIGRHGMRISGLDGGDRTLAAGRRRG